MDPSLFEKEILKPMQIFTNESFGNANCFGTALTTYHVMSELNYERN